MKLGVGGISWSCIYSRYMGLLEHVPNGTGMLGCGYGRSLELYN